MTDLVLPPRLVPGDTIGVAALSGPSDPERLAAGARALEGLGYRVRLAPNALAKEPLLGLAGTAAERAAGYRALLVDDTVKAIVFSRGGYGVSSALKYLDPAEAARNAKIHCGFSDVTVLSAWLLKAGVPSFHGPMVAADLARGLDPFSATFFPSMLEGRGPKEISFEDEKGKRGAAADGSSSCCVLVPGSASPELSLEDVFLFLPPRSGRRTSTTTTAAFFSSKKSPKRRTGSTGCSGP